MQKNCLFSIMMIIISVFSEACTLFCVGRTINFQLPTKWLFMMVFPVSHWNSVTFFLLVWEEWRWSQLNCFQFFFFFGGWEVFAVAPHCERDPWRCGRMELKVFCLDEHLSIYHNKYANHSRHFEMEKSHTKLPKAISQQRRVPKEIYKPTTRMGASPKTNIIIKLK